MTSTTRRFSPLWMARSPGHILAGWMSIGGGLLSAMGVTLPWLSFFAGLQPVTALGTPNGTVLLVGAALSALSGMVLMVRPSRWSRGAVTVTGVALTAFSAYLAVGLVDIYRDVSADPLMVAQLGPGLILVLIGSVLVLSTALVGD